MNKRLRALLAGAALAAAVVTAALTGAEILTSPQNDTAWGASATTDTTDDVTPLDTAWG
jgi:hypothetical protein